IEHHTGLLSTCDRLVELGPTGGDRGGYVIAMGTPEEIAENTESVTGKWLEAREPMKTLARETQRRNGRAKGARAGRCDAPRQPPHRAERSRADAAHRARRRRGSRSIGQRCRRPPDDRRAPSVRRR